MKKDVILACTALKSELEAAKEKTACKHETIYFESDLHISPERLGEKIEKQIVKSEDVNNIYIAMGMCGKAIEGLRTPIRLIIPKVDDCITMLLTVNDDSCLNLKKPGHMYYTEGMAELLEKGADFCSTELSYGVLIDRYGKDYADSLLRDIYRGYVGFDIIDTGVVPVENIYDKARNKADIVGCPVSIVPGSNMILEKMCRNEIDEQFMVFQPGTIINFNAFM